MKKCRVQYELQQHQRFEMARRKEVANEPRPDPDGLQQMVLKPTLRCEWAVEHNRGLLWKTQTV